MLQTAERKELSMEELEETEIEVLREIHQFCAQNHLRYFIFFGSLIGAIRHKGFIPWDDDMDISMPRADYEFFIHHFDSPRFGVFSCTTNPDYPYPFAKAFDKQTVKEETLPTSMGEKRIPVPERFEMGVDVDIFPLDDSCSPALADQANGLYQKLCTKWVRCMTPPTGEKSAAGRVKDLIRRLYLNKHLNQAACEINRFCAQHADPKSGKCGVFTDPSMPNMLLMDKSWFEASIEVPFESDTFFVPAGFDEFLRACYGDYMTPPPEDARESTHHFKAYRKV